MKRFVHTGDTADMIERPDGRYTPVDDALEEIERVRATLLDDIRSAARYVDVFEGPRLSVLESVEIAIMYALESEIAAKHLHDCVVRARESA
mgnify:CR=1 FL=1